MIAKTATLAALLAAVTACSGVRNPPRPVENVQPVEQTHEERLASVLAKADRAAAAGDRQALGDALVALDAMGAQALDDAAKTELANWDALRPNDVAPMRGRALGPGFKTGLIAPGASTVIEQTFLSGRKASIAMSTPAGETLALGVRNSEPRLLCEKRGARASCSWVPVFTDRYRIELANPGRQRARYYLVIN